MSCNMSQCCFCIRHRVPCLKNRSVPSPIVITLSYRDTGINGKFMRCLRNGIQYDKLYRKDKMRRSSGGFYMEKRDFGNTGLRTSLLGFGGFHLLEIPLAEAKVLLNSYLDAGGNYIETAFGYGDGESERKIGRSVSHRRDEYTLVTKTGERGRQGCLDSLDRSLENLQTDHVDVLLMHAVGTMEELDALLSPEGAVAGAEQAVREGKARFIGLSMHGQPDVLVEALRRYPFRAVMTTINYYDHFNFPEIEDILLPLAHSRNTAVILMKPVADGLLYRSAEPAFRYAFSQPVSVVVAGINNRAMLAADLAYAESFVPMS